MTPPLVEPIWSAQGFRNLPFEVCHQVRHTLVVARTRLFTAFARDEGRDFGLRLNLLVRLEEL